MILILLCLHPSGVWKSSKQRVSCRFLESTALFPGHLCQRRSDSKRRWLSIAKEGWETGEDADGVCFCARTERLRLCLVELFGTRFHFHFFPRLRCQCVSSNVQKRMQTQTVLHYRLVLLFYIPWRHAFILQWLTFCLFVLKGNSAYCITSLLLLEALLLVLVLHSLLFSVTVILLIFTPQVLALSSLYNFTMF